MQQLMQQLDVRLRQIPMPELPVEERIRTFSEVALGYSEEQALAESARCLQCEHPLCMEMCPLHVDIRGFIRLIRLGAYIEAAEKVREKNCLPSVCGRVCPQEVLCMMGCKNTIGDPVNIGALERFVADWELEKGASVPGISASTGKSVAVVGSGPAGLSAAAELAMMGHHVVIFEALHEAGGVMTYGIPEFRLPKKVVRQEIDRIKRLGVKIKTNVVIGRTITIDELFDEGFNSVFLGSGAGLPKLLGIPGENLCGVYSLNEFLLRINLMKAHSFPKTGTPIKVHDKVAILGARGLDAARCALRLGAREVCIFYQWKVVGRKDEIRRGMEEGVKFVPLTKPLRLIGDEKRWVKQVEFANLELGPLGKTGKPKLIAIEGSRFLYDAETVVIASEHNPNTLAATNTLRNIKIAEKQKTVVVNPITLEVAEGIFAGGDVVSGASSVIKAIEMGKRAAHSIDNYLLQ
jgi:glutamate synthase (NADPH/NADH) small chain